MVPIHSGYCVRRFVSYEKEDLKNTESARIVPERSLGDLQQKKLNSDRIWQTKKETLFVRIQWSLLVVYLQRRVYILNY